MKKTILLSVMIAAAVTLMAQVQKEVVTGASYVDDVYYSLENGVDTSVVRDNWDLGFSTNSNSAEILANHVEGVEVYAYPGDITAWETVDTTGMLWNQMYNSTESFWEGAFQANALDFPDYGWGVYNFGSHDVIGDSLFVIKTIEGNLKKLAIIVKAATNTWEFKYANLDGSDEHMISLNADEYSSKNFVYYSVDNQEIVDKEPAKADWELLFTKYITMLQMGPMTVPYGVSGIFSNENHVVVEEVRETGLDQPTFVSYTDTSFSSNISIIGYDWKQFNGVTYDLIDTVVYFIKKYSNWDPVEKEWQDSAYYKIYFTDFTGSSEGKYTFMQEKLSLVSARSPEMIQMLEVYPNPASEYLNVVFDHMGETALQVIDMTGRTVYSTIHEAGGFTNLSLDIASLNPGFFFLKVNASNKTGVIRFIKQ